MKFVTYLSMALAVSLTLSGCGGSGGGNASAPSAPTGLSVTASAKALNFSWDSVPGTDYYQIFENPDGASGYTQIGSDLSAASASIEIPVHETDWVNASYLVSACNEGGCTDSSAIDVNALMLDAIGYIKANNTGNGDRFGVAVAVSDDGSTIAVGAEQEDSNSAGIDGAQNSDGINVGAVYVFHKEGTTWSQQAFIKPANPDNSDYFGRAMSISADGNTLAVASPGESGSATTINGSYDNDAYWAGAVYIFVRDSGGWSQQAYIKPSNAEGTDYFGYSLSLSNDGNTLAVGAPEEDGGDTGTSGDPSANTKAEAGAAYVFVRSGTDWSQQAYIKASNTQANDYFGVSISVSGDGDTLAVGGFDGSNATGIDGDATDNTYTEAGSVHVYTRSGTSWSQQAYVKASNTGNTDNFGYAVALSDDGNVMAVSATDEDSNGIGVNGSQDNNSALNSGAVYVYTRSAGVWSQQTYIKSSNSESSDYLGYGLALSGDGNRLAIGSHYEASAATGINGDESDNSISQVGAVYLFAANADSWEQTAYVKPNNARSSLGFGKNAVALSHDGTSLLVGAVGEDSASTGIGGDYLDTSSPNSGAAYLY